MKGFKHGQITIANGPTDQVKIIKRMAKDFDNQIPDIVIERFTGKTVKETLINLHRFIREIQFMRKDKPGVEQIRSPRLVWFDMPREANSLELYLITACFLHKLKLKYEYILVGFNQREFVQHVYFKVYEPGNETPFIFDPLVENPFELAKNITKQLKGIKG